MKNLGEAGNAKLKRLGEVYDLSLSILRPSLIILPAQIGFQRLLVSRPHVRKLQREKGTALLSPLTILLAESGLPVGFKLAADRIAGAQLESRVLMAGLNVDPDCAFDRPYDNVELYR